MQHGYDVGHEVILSQPQQEIMSQTQEMAPNWQPSGQERHTIEEKHEKDENGNDVLHRINHYYHADGSEEHNHEYITTEYQHYIDPNHAHGGQNSSSSKNSQNSSSSSSSSSSNSSNSSSSSRSRSSSQRGRNSRRAANQETRTKFHNRARHDHDRHMNHMIAIGEGPRVTNGHSTNSSSKMSSSESSNESYQEEVEFLHYTNVVTEITEIEETHIIEWMYTLIHKEKGVQPVPKCSVQDEIKFK